jgi:cysteinyl-tRNA synthetase
VAITVYNTLNRRKEELVTRDPGTVSMYVCGPTVYNHIHVGNARAILVFVVIRRYLRWRGFKVTFVQNYTDVDDKIIAAAEQEGRSPEEVASFYSSEFEKVMESVGAQPPDVLVKATEHIAEMLEMISLLIGRGIAYESRGNVWFSVGKFSEYGKLSGRKLDELRAGERVEPDPSKHDPMDFALWKAAKPGEPFWESPWGPGRPGWHIECSAMSLKQLGMGFDVHGGGQDLIFPHHENEIAQSEAALGEEPFVRYWLHNGLVNFESEKMSKSLGNFILLKDFIEQVDPQVFRVLVLSSHYRAALDFTEQQISNARGVLERFAIFRTAAAALVSPDAGAALFSADPDSEGAELVLPEADSKGATEFIERFKLAMDDDFHTPGALAVMHELVRAGNAEIQRADNGDEGAKRRVGGLLNAFLEIAGVLGIELDVRDDISREVQDLIDRRNQARLDGNYAEADRIRDQLKEMAVVLEDTPSGTRWRRSIS